ncbi:MAG: RNA-binding transcriptional accessory protein [Lachnospiraceae bacterium]|nr:RNA-binding transcriptional accessory protein [Lachnospiraceae bacterium]
MNIPQMIAQELGIEEWQVNAVIALLDEGNTIPFIARYRKEKHGSLDDEQLRNLYERLTYLRGLEERKAAVLKSIEEQGKLTPELEKQIREAVTLVAVEDLYRPYKQKRRTRAMIAREKGLEPLAVRILLQKVEGPLMAYAAHFVSEEKGVTSPEEAVAGASDIIAEHISDNPEFRTWIRNRTRGYGIIRSEKKEEDEKGVFATYYGFESRLEKMTGYRTLALNRGEKEKKLTVRLEAPEEDILRSMNRRVIRREDPETAPVLQAAIADAYHRLIAPSIENELRGELTEQAEDGAIEVFKKNLTQYLMQPPISGETVLGWDPAFRTGCKLAVVDPTGKVLDTAVIYPTAPTNETKKAEARRVLTELIRAYHVTLVSVGNGTASRESEQFLTDFLKTIPEKVMYVITNEAGASVYSASKLATEEFPNFDVGQRSAASIARRVQDPLAELVKIDPKAIGVGQYQHDMNQKKLGDALGGVVEDCVNRVGVDLNTASAPLLTYISGITKAVASNIVAYREENGHFTSRKQLLNVPKLGPKAFEQCAGFLRIRDGSNPLDNTGVHPESYAAAEKLLEKTGLEISALKEGPVSVKIRNYGKTAEELGIGEPTLRDIVKELGQPGRDPREDMPLSVLRSDVCDLEDLKEGMVLKGTVRNIVDFGAFVDIGVHEDGLVHISRMSKKKFVKHPLDVVSIGDVVEVKVVSIDLKKKRIGLSMIL